MMNIDDGEGDEFDLPCKYTPEQIKRHKEYAASLPWTVRSRCTEGCMDGVLEKMWADKAARKLKSRTFQNVGEVPHEQRFIPNTEDVNHRMMTMVTPIQYHGTSIAPEDYYIREVKSQGVYYLHIRKTILKEIKKK